MPSVTAARPTPTSVGSWTRASWTSSGSGSSARRTGCPQHAGRGRRRPRRGHAERHLLAPLLLRRLRRDPQRRPVADHRRRLTPDPGTRVAAPDRRARRVRRAGRRERRSLPGRHGRGRQWLGHDRRAGLGRTRPTGQACCPAGEGTRSATPLLWSHAGLLRLAWTIQAGHPVDQQAVVADRYR